MLTTENIKTERTAPKNLFLEACNWFELDLQDLKNLKNAQKEKFSESRQRGVLKLEKKIKNRIRVTPKDVLQKIGEFLMNKEKIDLSLMFLKLIEEALKEVK
jgi:hypothetical protein